MKKKVGFLLVALMLLGWYASIKDMNDAPANYYAHIESAQRYEEKGIFIDAVNEYNQALELLPGDIGIYCQLANAYKQLGQEQKYEAALKTVAESEDERSVQALDELMQYYIEINKDKTAIDYILAYTENYPDRENAYDWFFKLKGSYAGLHLSCDEMYEIYNDSLPFKRKGKYGLSDSLGTQVIEPVYKFLSPFSEDGYALCEDEDGNRMYIDKDRYVRIKPDSCFSDTGMLINGRITACNDSKYGYLGSDGEPVSSFEYDDITAFNAVGAAKKNGQWSLIDDSGVPVTEFVFDDVKSDRYNVACNQKRLFVKIDGKYRMIDTEGEMVTDFEYDDAKPFSSSGMAAVCKDGKWGFADTKGSVVIPCTYDDAFSFTNGYAAVKAGEFWGYIDTDNYMVIQPSFEEATAFSSKGSAVVKIPKTEEDDSYWKLIRLVITE